MDASNAGEDDMSMKKNWLSAPEPGAPCSIIAEVAQAHDGSLGMAHAFIDCAARCGAHAVKFQTHIAESESTRAEPWRVKFSRQDDTRFDYWKRMEFKPEQWAGLKTHAEEKGLVFMSSPFSLAAVELLASIGMKVWKIASGEVSNMPMLRTIAARRQPVILSSGMSDLSEVALAVKQVSAAGAPLAVLQCTTSYPSPPEKIGLNVLDLFRREFGTAVGLSDHSGTIYPSLAAVAAHRAEVLEVHLTLSRDMFGPDVSSSVTPAELTQIVEGVRFIETMHANPADKQVLATDIAAMRGIFTKSIVAAENLAAGTRLDHAQLTLKKAGGGMPAGALESLIGKVLNRALAKDEPLHPGDVS